MKGFQDLLGVSGVPQVTDEATEVCRQSEGHHTDQRKTFGVQSVRLDHTLPLAASFAVSCFEAPPHCSRGSVE